MPRYVFLSSILLIYGCVTNFSDFSDVKRLEKEGYSEVSVKVSVKAFKFRFNGASYTAPSVQCGNGEGRSFLMVIPQQRASADEKFCKSGAAQALLSSGYTVYAVFTPEAPPEIFIHGFGGKLALASVRSFIRGLGLKGETIQGIWGVGEAVVTAAIYSRENPQLEVAIFASGFFDMESTLANTKDASIREKIEKLRNLGGEEAIEERSIAWDPSGFPKKVFVYHGEKDEVSPKEDASGFREALATAGTQVELVIITGSSHNISDKQHFSLIFSFLNKK